MSRLDSRVHKRLVRITLPATLVMIPLSLRPVLIKNKDDLTAIRKLIFHGYPPEVRFTLLGEQVSELILKLPLEFWISFNGNDLLEVYDGTVLAHRK